MSDALNRVKAAGGAVAEVLEQHEQKLEGIADVGRQVEAIHRQLLTEKQISDDRFETLCKKLDRIAEQLGSNGTGGH